MSSARAKSNLDLGGNQLLNTRLQIIPKEAALAPNGEAYLIYDPQIKMICYHDGLKFILLNPQPDITDSSDIIVVRNPDDSISLQVRGEEVVLQQQLLGLDTTQGGTVTEQDTVISAIGVYDIILPIITCCFIVRMFTPIDPSA